MRGKLIRETINQYSINLKLRAHLRVEVVSREFHLHEDVSRKYGNQNANETDGCHQVEPKTTMGFVSSSSIVRPIEDDKSQTSDSE